MNCLTKLTAGALLAAGLAVAPAVAASAIPADEAGVSLRAPGSGSASAGGGSWGWGITGNTVFSDYNHPSRCHGSTAIGKDLVRITGKPKNVVSKARTPKKASGNQAFYHLC